jgi:hypothetical protein
MIPELREGESMLVIGLLVVGLAVTWILSRIGLRLLREWDAEGSKLFLVHGGTLSLCWMVYAFVDADNGVPDWFAGHIFFAPQVVWAVRDILGESRSSGAIDPRGAEPAQLLAPGQFCRRRFSRAAGAAINPSSHRNSARIRAAGVYILRPKS